MKSPHVYLLAFLAVTTLGGAALAWRQYGELVELRAAAMNREERADMQKRIWDLEKMARQLQDQLAAGRTVAESSEDVVAAAGEGERPRGEREGRGGRGGDVRSRGSDPMQQAAAMRELMNKPEVQAMMSLQQRAAIEARYAALFRTLNMSPEQTEKLKGLLAERGTTRMDVMAAATAQGIDPRENPEAYRKLFADAQNELNNSIKAVVGENGYAQLQNYEQTLPQRSLVNDLQQRLSYSNTPLSASQADALVQILASNSPPRSPQSAASSGPTDGMQVQITRGAPGGPGSPGGRGGDFMSFAGPALGPVIGMVDGIGRGGSGAVVTPGAVAQAQSVLAPAQLAALQQIQQQQQAQQQLQQLVRETLSANQPPRGGAATATGTAPTPGASTSSPTPARRGGGE